MNDNQSGLLAQLYEALALAQGEFQPIVKNREVEIYSKRTNSKYKFRYADLEEITRKTRPALAKHGLAVTQPLMTTPKGMVLRTVLAHKAGGVIVSELDLTRIDGGEIKDFGAQVSYLRRYAKSAMLDIAADDDADEDGGEAGEAQPMPRAHEPPRQPPQPVYDQERFEENLPEWRRRIEVGELTPERLIAFLLRKSALSESQIDTLNACARKEGTA